MFKKIAAVAAVVFVAATFVLACMAVKGYEPVAGSGSIAEISAVPTPHIPEETSAEYYGSIIFMGDTMLARGIGSRIQNGDDPYKHVKDELAKHSLRVGNIETTIADPKIAANAASKPYTFNAPLSSLDILRANIDVSALANNHTSDYGPAATSDMIKQFQNKGLAAVGIGNDIDEAFKPLVVDMRLQNPNDSSDTTTLKIGFISVNDIDLNHAKVRDDRPGGAYFDSDLIAKAISQAREQGAAFVFVLPHWGIEYQSKPSARQIEWGKRFIDVGADGVIGSHPHVVQPTEFYKDKPIVYSLGNFIFDGMEGSANIGQMVVMPITVTKITGLQNKTSASFGKPESIKIQINSLGYPTIAQE